MSTQYDSNFLNINFPPPPLLYGVANVLLSIHVHVGFLRKASQYDILYKPVQAGSKGPREVMFYEGLFDPPEESLPRDLQRLKKLIPGYYGVCDITDRAGETSILFIKTYMYACCLMVKGYVVGVASAPPPVFPDGGQC